MRLQSAAAALLLCAVASAADAPEGLELTLSVTTKGPVQPGEKIDVEMKLANRSKSAAKIVRPNEGSQRGWREPHMFWTATFVGKDGAERAIPAVEPSGDGGLFVPEWWKEVSTLEPDSTMTVGFIAPPDQVFDVQEDGKLRLVAHYKWGGGKESRGDPLSGGASAPANLGGMADVAPFEITSKPAEIEVRRQFEVVATTKAAFRVGIVAPLSTIADVRVHSLSTSPIHFDPADWKVVLVNDPKAELEPDESAVAPRKGADAFDLAPGAAAPLLREGPLAASRDLKLKFPTAGVARFALLLQRANGTGPNIRSNWIEVKVEK